MTEQDKFKAAIESIEPENGAKERMLANIKRKAAEQRVPEKKPLPLKWAAPLAACLVVAVAAVIGVRTLPSLTETANSSEYVQNGSPFQPVDSAEEFVKRLGITLDAPTGASDVQYAIIDNETANVDFSYNGVPYTARASKQGGDFSGISGVEISVEQLDSADNAVLTVLSSGDTYLKLTWTDGTVSYVLTCMGDDTDGIKEIYSLIK
ncbi:MAG: hypothetical protein NC299_13640 [Lachnospiraceae bacterium]|nr:hypothetical protein [Ruminococcus sp.]MCM1276378.1 hypothetical protein [Lachnospiraceae bacterium]